MFRLHKFGFGKTINFTNNIRINKNISTLVPWSKQKDLNPIKITGGNDSYLFSDKRKIVDFTSGLMVVNLGHNNKYIQEGFHKHIKTGIGYTSPFFGLEEREKLSDRLINITGLNDGKVFYTNGGADANEVAIFLALEYHKGIGRTEQYRTLSFNKSFHGGSSIVSSLISGDERKNGKLNHFNEFSNKLESIIPNPYLSDDGKITLNFIENEFKKGNVASVLFEGSSGTAGIVIYPKYFLQKVKNLCERYGVLFICDEVMSGWGRTGKLFGYQHHNIIPDIITTAKAITNGYVQLGSVMISNKISSYFDENLVLTGLTYFGHPLACTIANKCLDLYLENDMEIMNSSLEKGKNLTLLGKDIENNVSIVQDYRNNGLLGCFELNIKDEGKLLKIYKKILENNIFVFRRNNLFFTAPPLIIDNDLLSSSMNKLGDIFKNNS